MKKPITVCATGLGHPESPYELDDGRLFRGAIAGGRRS
jgi:hypothetical protein